MKKKVVLDRAKPEDETTKSESATVAAASVAEARRRDGELSAADGECGETANRRRVAKSAASWRRVAF